MLRAIESYLSREGMHYDEYVALLNEVKTAVSVGTDFVWCLRWKKVEVASMTVWVFTELDMKVVCVDLDDVRGDWWRISVVWVEAVHFIAIGLSCVACSYGWTPISSLLSSDKDSWFFWGWRSFLLNSKCRKYPVKIVRFNKQLMFLTGLRDKSN